MAETVFVIFTVKLVKWSKIHKLDYFDYYWARAEVSNPIFWGAEFVTPNPFSWLLSIFFLKNHNFIAITVVYWVSSYFLNEWLTLMAVNGDLWARASISLILNRHLAFWNRKPFKTLELLILLKQSLFHISLWSLVQMVCTAYMYVLGKLIYWIEILNK